MAEGTKAAQRRKSGTTAETPGRDERLKAALKANIRRRKAQLSGQVEADIPESDRGKAPDGQD